MPVLKKSFSRRRSRIGDFLAVLLLAAAVGAAIWFWWHQRHPNHTEKHPPAVFLPVVITPKATVPTHPVLAMPAPPVRPVIPIEKNKPNPVEIATPATAGFPRPARDVFEIQVALARRAISPGSIDSAMGSQTRAAIAAFQRSEKLFANSVSDTNTLALPTLNATPLTTYQVTTNDLTRLQPLGKTWLAKSQQTALDYETILELIAEKAHSNPPLLQKLNPAVNWTNISGGTLLRIPDVNYPEPDGKAAFVVIHLSEKYLEAFDAETNLLAHFPCSIAAKVEKRPVGELHVIVIAPNPNYTVNPELFPESSELQAIGHKLILPPGPNNPVGVAWIGLDRQGYGMHGTPVPEQVGRTESHGCFRLANWDAEYLLKLSWIGLPVNVVP